jgi:hypothetical protein
MCVEGSRPGSHHRRVWQCDLRIRCSKPHSRPAERIERLEIRIEELREAIERSLRLMLAGRVCVLIGPVLLVCLMFGLLDLTVCGGAIIGHGAAA